MFVMPNHHSNAANILQYREARDRINIMAIANPIMIFITANALSAQVHCLLLLQIDHRTKFGCD